MEARGLKFGTQIAIHQYYLSYKPEGKRLDNGGVWKGFSITSIFHRQ